MAPIATRKRRTISARVVLVIAIVVSMGLISLWFGEGDGGFLHTTRSVVSAVAYPFEKAGSLVAMPFQAIGNAFTNAGASQEDITALQDENEQLRAQVIQDEEYRQENERLTTLLNMSQSYALQSTGANVISQSADSWNRTITLDKGSNDGIEVGMPVLSGEGLIGQVDSVSAASCEVRLLTDESSGVAVTLQTSRAEGVVSGSVDGLLYLDYIPTSTDVTLGEAVITSGLGGVYPKGLIVGIVSRIEGSDTDTYRTIVIQPIASSTVNEEALILTGNETEAAQGATVIDGTTTTTDSTTTGTDSTTTTTEGSGQ